MRRCSTPGSDTATDLLDGDSLLDDDSTGPCSTSGSDMAANLRDGNSLLGEDFSHGTKMREYRRTALCVQVVERQAGAPGSDKTTGLLDEDSLLDGKPMGKPMCSTPGSDTATSLPRRALSICSETLKRRLVFLLGLIVAMYCLDEAFGSFGLLGFVHPVSVAWRVLLSIAVMLLGVGLWQSMETAVLKMLVSRARVIYFVGSVLIGELGLQLPMAYGQPGREFRSCTLLNLSSSVVFVSMVFLDAMPEHSNGHMEVLPSPDTQRRPKKRNALHRAWHRLTNITQRTLMVRIGCLFLTTAKSTHVINCKMIDCGTRFHNFVWYIEGHHPSNMTASPQSSATSNTTESFVAPKRHIVLSTIDLYVKCNMILIVLCVSMLKRSLRSPSKTLVIREPLCA